MSSRNKYLVDRLAEFGTTIFATMSALAVRTGAINLGQGFPDTDGSQEVLEEAVWAIRNGHNQYPPGIGIPKLRHAVAEHQKRFYDLDFDPDTEVLITAGATEAIAAAILSLCETGDEVVCFEPYYDSYTATIALARATRKLVQLKGPDKHFDAEEFERAVSGRTRLILLNSPHNPTGKVFSRQELEHIADVAKRRDLLVVTDEVYEHLVFDGEHIPLATLPGMRERTITISSGAKTFSATGWKIGWVCATPELTSAVQTSKQFLTYVNGGPFQHAIAKGLGLGDDYYTALATDLRSKRDLLAEGLKEAGFEVWHSSGTYYLTVHIGGFGESDGAEFCLALPERCGVVAVPSVVFYDDKDAGGPLVRFAFCKRTEVLEEACRRLANLKSAAASPQSPPNPDPPNP